MSDHVKIFTKYASLSVMGMLGLSCYILADTYFISKGLGTRGLAALNLAIPIYSIINGIGLMTGMGGASVFSILSGRKDRKRVCVFSCTLLIATAVSVILVISGWFFTEKISVLLGADDETFELCRIYIRTLLICSPAFILNNIINCFIRNDNAPRLSMAAMLTGSFSNILLDYIFIFPLDLGMFGAVLATCIAPVISLGVMSVFFIKNRNSFHIVKSVPDFKLCTHIIVTGIPSLITELSSAAVILVFNAVTMAVAGNVGVAAYGITANISIIVISIFNGISQGMQPLASKSVGKGDNASAAEYQKLALISSVALSAAIYAFILFFADPITEIFNNEKDPLLHQIAAKGLRLYFIGCIFSAVNIVKAAYFAAAGQHKPANIISFLRGFALIIPLSLVMSKLFGINGLWLSFAASEISALAISRFISPDRIRKESAEHF